MKIIERVFLRLAFFVLLPIALQSQKSSSEVRGSVVDARPGPIGGATVVLRGSGIERTMQTDAAGLYRFAALPEGEYELRIEHSGFQTLTVRDVHLEKSAAYVLPPIELPFCGMCCSSRAPAYLRPLDSSSAGSGALGGAVVDSEGRPIAGAEAKLYVPGILSPRAASGDRQGRFSVMNTPLRRDYRYRIEVSAHGFFTEEFTDFWPQPGYEVVYALDLFSCEGKQCRPELRPVRVQATCA